MHDRDRIEDMDGRIRMIPGLVDAIIARAAQQFPFAYSPLTEGRSQFWLNCKSNAKPSATKPLRHHGNCTGKFRLIVRNPNIPADKPEAVISLNVTDRTNGGDVRVSTEQMAMLTDIHDDFAYPGKRH